MSEQEKKVNVSLDEESVILLKELNVIHRNSALNIGLKMLSKTELWNTLTGTPNEKLTQVASLGSLDELERELEAEVKTKAKTVAKSDDDWDNF